MKQPETVSTESDFDCFGSGSIDEVASLLPTALSPFVETAPDVIGVSQETALAAALTQMTAAMGGSDLLQIPGLGNIPAQINLVMVAKTVSETTWLQYSAQPLMLSAKRALQLRAQVGPEEARRRYMERHRRMSDKDIVMARNIEPDECMAWINACAAHKPRTIVWGNGRVAEIKEALPGCYDHTVCLCNGAVDPLFEWMKLPRTEREELLKLLSHSWNRIPLLTSSRGEALPATLQMIVGTGQEEAERWLSESRRWLDRQRVPILMFRQEGTPHWMPREEALQKSMLHLFMENCDERRKATIGPRHWEFEPNAIALLESFQKDFIKKMQILPEHEQKEVQWITDVTLRLSLLFAATEDIFRSDSSRLIDNRKTTAKTISVKDTGSAVLLTRWLAAHHLKTLRWLRKKTSPDRPDNTDIPDNGELEDRLAEKLRDKGAMTRRELQRSYHQVSAKERDLSIERLISKGRIKALEDGRLVWVET
jgi:hypothetical protein